MEFLWSRPVNYTKNHAWNCSFHWLNCNFHCVKIHISLRESIVCDAAIRKILSTASVILKKHTLNKDLKISLVLPNIHLRVAILYGVKQENLVVSTLENRHGMPDNHSPLSLRKRLELATTKLNMFRLSSTKHISSASVSSPTACASSSITHNFNCL